MWDSHFHGTSKKELERKYDTTPPPRLEANERLLTGFRDL